MENNKNNFNILKIQEKLSDKYKYYPLEKELSEKYRKFFTENIPSCFEINGSNTPIYSFDNTIISNGYNRIVVGDYGAFIEFDENQACIENYKIKEGQEYRIEDKKYSKYVKYIWLTAKDNSDVKIYLQKKKVSYADYRPKMYYVSPYEVKVNNI